MKNTTQQFKTLGFAALLAAGFAAGSVWAQTRNDALFAAATTEQPATVKTLERLVNIETGTGNAEGMSAMGQLLEAELKALGATVTRHKAAGDVVGENIVGRLQGKGGKRLLLIAHMDTVYVKGTLEKAPFRIDGNRAFGPGIADDKGGIAVILHALRVLKAQGFQGFGSITVMFNTDEEKGSFGSRDLIQALAKENDYVLSFEPTLAMKEGMTLGTSGIAYVEARIKGKASTRARRPSWAPMRWSRPPTWCCAHRISTTRRRICVSTGPSPNPARCPTSFPMKRR